MLRISFSSPILTYRSGMNAAYHACPHRKIYRGQPLLSSFAPDRPTLPIASTVDLHKEHLRIVDIASRLQCPCGRFASCPRASLQQTEGTPVELDLSLQILQVVQDSLPVGWPLVIQHQLIWYLTVDVTTRMCRAATSGKGHH